MEGPSYHDSSFFNREKYRLILSNLKVLTQNVHEGNKNKKYQFMSYILKAEKQSSFSLAYITILVNEIKK